MMPGLGLAAVEGLRAVDVVGGRVGRRAAAAVLMVDVHRPGPGPGSDGSGSGPGLRSSRHWRGRTRPRPVAHRGRGDAVGDPARDQFGGRLRAGPARQRHTGLGGQPAGQRLGIGDLHGGETRGAPGAPAVGQGRQTAVGEPAAPGTNRVRVQTRLPGDTRVGAPPPRAGRPARASAAGTRSCGRRRSSSTARARQRSGIPGGPLCGRGALTGAARARPAPPPPRSVRCGRRWPAGHRWCGRRGGRGVLRGSRPEGMDQRWRLRRVGCRLPSKHEGNGGRDIPFPMLRVVHSFMASLCEVAGRGQCSTRTNLLATWYGADITDGDSGGFSGLQLLKSGGRFGPAR